MAQTAPYSKTLIDNVFGFLDVLRESGVTNMLGSPAYVEREFNIPRQHASAIARAWIEAFSTDGTSITDEAYAALTAKVAQFNSAA